MTSSPRHYQYYLVMGPDFYGSVCAIYLRSMLHTAEIISAVRCTPLRSSLWCVQKLSPRYVVRDNLRGMMHSAEIPFVIETNSKIL